MRPNYLSEVKRAIYDNFMTYRKIIIAGILLFLISLSIGGFITYKIMYNQLEDAYDRIKYLKQINANEKLVEEMKTISKAVEDLKKNKPVTEPIASNNETDIKYVQKQTAEDPDVEIRSEAPVARVKYNEQTYDVPMQTTTTNSTEKDGTVKVNQKHEFTVDVTNVADRQIAAYKLSRDEKERELNEELKEVKHQNKQLKIAGGVVAAGAVGYLIHKASK